MNPNPLSSLNHFTVPVVITGPPSERVLCVRGRLLSAGAGTAFPGDSARPVRESF
jgi:hypothetical protein